MLKCQHWWHLNIYVQDKFHAQLSMKKSFITWSPVFWVYKHFYSMIAPLKYYVFGNIMENRAFALLEQMLHFSSYFQKYSKLYLIFFLILFQCCLKIENDVMI